MALRLLWFGHPRIERDGQTIRFEMRKAVALLAYLSLERREHAREALAGLFWPDYDQDHALGNLRQIISSLNKSLGPVWSESSREALRLHPAWTYWLDVDVFQQRLSEARAHHHVPDDVCAVCSEMLKEAVALYRGDFLDGFTLPACPEFNDWQLFKRESLRRELALALEILAERLAAIGSWGPAIDCGRRWVGLDPQHEPAHRLLMGLYSRSGERSAAMRQYETCRQMLAVELDQAPDAATIALYEQIATTALSTESADLLIHTKLRLPFTRPELVLRPRLQEQIAKGLRGPLTLIIAPAGFGKTTLVASCIASCGLPVAWLSLDRNDNQVGNFHNYLIAALRETDHTIGNEAAQLVAAARPIPCEAVLTSLINDLDTTGNEIVLVLDDYQVISNQTVHQAVAFLLEHCPKTFHLLIATRSDPPLPVARLRACGQMIELRAADLRFTELEAARFLNDVMGLHLDAAAVAVLEERTEGWIAGLQMAALSMRDHKDVVGFIAGFSGTNRYILDYLLEEVLAGQPPEIQRFLLYTSILERLTAPLCDAVLASDEGADGEGDVRWTRSESLFVSQSASILEYIERASLFLMPLDDERIWYRYHRLFADLLRTQLQRSLGAQGVIQLHVRAADWHGQNGTVPEAIHHASMASDDERVERFVGQNYMELVSRGEQSWLRSWTGKLSKELIYRRPWLCIYAAYSHSWFGELEEAERLLEEAEKRIRSGIWAPDAQAMQGLLAYVKSRVTAMRGDLQRAIALCLKARELIPASNLALQLDTSITLGYEYFLNGDYANAHPILSDTVRSGIAAGAVINTVAASCIMARLYGVQGLLHKSYDTYQIAAQLIPEASGQHLGARALVEVGIAELLCEWNDLEAALVHLKRGLDMLPWWGKADDLALAHITLARIHLAQANKSDAIEAVDKAVKVSQASEVFSEARRAVESAQVRLWLAQGDLPAASSWAASLKERLGSDNLFGFENELTHITRARVFLAQNKPLEAIALLSHLEENARSARRMGRVLEILLVEALALREMDDCEHALLALTECLTVAEPEEYVRTFLDEGRPMQLLLAQWLVRAGSSPLRDYAIHLLSHFDAEPHRVTATQGKISPAQELIEPLSQRELEVLHFMALGRTNQQIARQLIVAPGTIKAHTASIYRKLDVANRTEAVASARQLGILP